MVDPTITVVIPAYNAAKYLGEALESVLTQTRRPDEIIVIDDGSTDDTTQVIERFGKAVVTIRQQNAGEGAARNAGIRAARGDYIAFLDADDVCAPERLDRQALALGRSSDAVACYSGHWTFSSERRLDFPAKQAEIVDSLTLLAECQFVAASVMFRRHAAVGLLFPEERNASAIDLIFSAVLATRGRVIALPEMLYGYRIHPQQISIAYQANGKSNAFFEFRYRWAKEHWQDYWPQRGWLEVERYLWEGLVRQTEAAYWARYKRFFLNDRDYLRRHWPPHLPKPPVLSWRWYPDWVWSAKGMVDRLIPRT